ncbi:unnamed protein product [Pylaiella littoralis]
MFALLGSSHLCSLNCFVSVSLLSFLSLAETLWNDLKFSDIFVTTRYRMKREHNSLFLLDCGELKLILGEREETATTE